MDEVVTSDMVRGDMVRGDMVGWPALKEEKRSASRVKARWAAGIVELLNFSIFQFLIL